METLSHSPKKLGRPRSFDRDLALQSAMRTFWAHGYETTSIVDLTDAMGINAPAIYSAFGNKEALFREAMALYRGDPDIEAEAIRNAPTAKDAARMVLGWAIERFTGEDTPKGCLIATSLATGSKGAGSIRSEGTKIRADIEQHLADRIRRDAHDGHLPAQTDPEALAAMVVCTVQGFSTLARDGASGTKLHAVANTILRAWP